eukprot:356350-Pelagomonas_calceolata.AAC.4
MFTSWVQSSMTKITHQQRECLEVSQRRTPHTQPAKDVHIMGAKHYDQVHILTTRVPGRDAKRDASHLTCTTKIGWEAGWQAGARVVRPGTLADEKFRPPPLHRGHAELSEFCVANKSWKSMACISSWRAGIHDTHRRAMPLGNSSWQMAMALACNGAQWHAGAPGKHANDVQWCQAGSNGVRWHAGAPGKHANGVQWRLAGSHGMPMVLGRQLWGGVQQSLQAGEGRNSVQWHASAPSPTTR